MLISAAKFQSLAPEPRVVVIVLVSQGFGTANDMTKAVLDRCMVLARSLTK
ncbi:MAG: hypothetical protein ACFB0E_02325 [Leptolyngbyaceae cyanobacterium]